MKVLPSFSDQRTFGADVWNLIPFPEEPIVDQHMLAWLLDQRGGVTYEVGGGWAMISHHDLAHPDGLEESVELLRRFCAKIPPVAASMRSTKMAR